MDNNACTRREFCRTMGLGVAGLGLTAGLTAAERTAAVSADGDPSPNASAPDKPNFIIIFTDDQGYGDLGCFGSQTISTPRIDRMAREGLKLTSFYSQPVCGPARAALMTGCYPTRVMRAGADLSKWRLPSSEITIAEVLKEAGYATACVGKWDLSGRSPLEGMQPNDQGFDYYFGTLTANDPGMVPLTENKESRGQTNDMGSLTGMYTDKAVEFIEQHRDEPFFLYLAHTMPHVIIGASEQFRGRSKGGLYGDVIEEIDWNVGRVVDAVKRCGLEGKTYVIFMSDNGPWLVKQEMGGSASPLRNGKGSAWEGGFRVPCVMWAPGLIPRGRETDELVTTLDILPTIASLGDAKVPDDRVIDGVDQSAFITGKSEKGARDTFYYYVQDNLHAVRKGKWKLALPERKRFFDYARDPERVQSPELYDLESDISEKHNVADKHPDIVKRLLALADEAREDIGDMDLIGKNSRSK